MGRGNRVQRMYQFIYAASDWFDMKIISITLNTDWKCGALHASVKILYYEIFEGVRVCVL